MRTDLITVPIYVTDQHGQRVAGLKETDFLLRSNGRIMQPAYFASGAERVALLFALDASGSARAYIAEQREAALAMFTRFGETSRVAVLAFDEQPQLRQPFTNDLALVRAAFDLDARLNRRTAIFDAALAVVRAFKTAPSTQPERRIVILLSDGLDTASRTVAATVINEAQARGVSFYVIHFPLYAPSGNALRLRRPAKGFRELAGQTGGQYFLLADERAALEPHPSYDLRPVFRAITEDLQSQYLLGYYLEAQARTVQEQQVEVRLAPPEGRRLRVHVLRNKYLLNP